MPATDLLYRAVFGDGEDLERVPAGEWHNLASRAASDGVDGWLHVHSLRSQTPIPDIARRALETAYREIAATNCVRLDALGLLMAELMDAGLDALLMPGASLLPLYPDPGCRPMDDVDLLARPGHLAGIVAFLVSRGYQPLARHEGLLTNGHLVIDLHTDLVSGERLPSRRLATWMDPELAWRHRGFRVVEGYRLPVLGPEDEVLASAVHALKHSFGSLKWFLDLRMLLEEPLDWDLLRSRAERGNLGRVLAYSLRFLEQELGVELPAGVAGWGVAPSCGRVEEALLQRLFQGRPHAEWGEVLWGLSCQRRRDRVRFLVEFMFPRPQVLRQVFPHAPDYSLPVAYVLRFAQLCWRGSAVLTNLARGS